MQVLQLGHGGAVHVVPEMGKHSAAHSPVRAIFLLGFQVRLLGLFGVDNLMEACEDVATGDVLKGLTRLQEQASLGHLDLQLLVITSPNIKTWEARFSVDC